MLNALKLPASPLPSLSHLGKSKAIFPGSPFKKPYWNKNGDGKEQVEINMSSCLFSSESICSYIDIKTMRISSGAGENECNALLQQNLNMFTYFTMCN